VSEVEWLKTFSNNLYVVMKERGLTQEDIAGMTRYTQATVSRWLNGTQAPTVFAVLNLSYALDIECNELIDFGDRIKR
jgi:transcriptional regulator with XRE-family HTH domain